MSQERSSGLVISAIRTIPVLAPLAREFKGSHYRMTHRATVIVQVETTAGITGEAYAGDEDKSLGAIEAIIHKELSPALVGQDALRTELCWKVMYPATFDILRDRRLSLVAMGAVDAAIWDAVGKAHGQPLWKVWGGYRDEIQMIAIGGYYGEPLGSVTDEIQSYREMGLAGVKYKVGGASPAEDAARVAAARDVGGDDFVITVDANNGYTVADAVDFALRVEDLNIRWFEEPVEWPNDHRGLRDVRFRTSIPICAGQSEHSPSGCRDLMEAGSVDVCNFDASWSGGPTTWLRTAAIAHAYEVQMGHHEEPQVSTHLIASQAHGTYAECFHPDRDPFWWHLIGNRPELKNGWLKLSDRPGLGWDLDWDYIDKYRVRGD